MDCQSVWVKKKPWNSRSRHNQWQGWGRKKTKKQSWDQCKPKHKIIHNSQRQKTSLNHHSKEEEAPQEEEDSLTSKAINKTKPPQQDALAPTRRKATTSNHGQPTTTCEKEGRVTVRKKNKLRKKKKRRRRKVTEWTVTRTDESLCAFYMKWWRALLPFHHGCWVPQQKFWVHQVTPFRLVDRLRG